MRKEPRYCKHKATGQAYVRFDGKTIYLGKYDSPESIERYDRIKSEWLLNPVSAKAKTQSRGVTIADVCLAFLYFLGPSIYFIDSRL